MLTKQEIRQLGHKEMMDELQRSRRELLKTHFDIRSGSSKETHMVKNLRRYIARLQTIKHEAEGSAPASKVLAEKTAAPAGEQSSPAKPVTAKKSPKKTTQAKTSKPAKKSSTKSKTSKK